MNRLIELALAPKLGLLIRAACFCALSSLAIAVLIVLVPIPLVLVLGMGAAHLFGITGIVLFAIVILREDFRAEHRRKELERLLGEQAANAVDERKRELSERPDDPE